MAADGTERPGKKPPVVPPVVAPVVPPVVPPVVAPVGAPVVTPVAAHARKPAPPAPAAPAPAPAGGIERHQRATDRAIGYSGAPTGVLVAGTIALLSVLAALFAWQLVRTSAAGAVESVEAYAAAAARLLAAGELDWWEARNGAVEEVRARVKENLDKEELEIRKTADGPAKEALRQSLEAAKKDLDSVLGGGEKGVDAVQKGRNKDRLGRLSFQDVLVGADLYDAERHARGIGTAMPRADLVKSGDLLVGGFLITDKGIRGRVCLAPVKGRRDPKDAEEPLVGWAGVAVSAEPAWEAVEKANRSALLAGGVVLGLGLLGAVLALLMLWPLRRVRHDAEEFSRGNFEHRPAAPGGGEIGAVGRAVARMALTARDREIAAQAKAASATAGPQDHRPAVGAALAPGALLKVPNWEIEGTSRACLEIAGDFFDYSPAAAGRVCAVVAETSLRGLPAAFAAAQIQALFRALAPGADSASDLLDSLGAAAGPRLPEDASVHATVVLADPSSGKVEIARAGKSNPPVLWRAAAKGLETIGVEGPPLRRAGGAGTGGSAGHVEIALEPRDRLCLVSDGLFRARNSRKEKFGEQRLDGLVLKFAPMNSTAFVNMVVNEVDLFHEGADQRDDLTVLTVRRLR